MATHGGGPYGIEMAVNVAPWIRTPTMATHGGGLYGIEMAVNVAPWIRTVPIPTAIRQMTYICVLITPYLEVGLFRIIDWQITEEGGPVSGRHQANKSRLKEASV